MVESKTDNTSKCATGIRAKIEQFPAGKVFSPSNFYELGDRGAIDMALKRLTNEKLIRNIARGLYDKPEYNSILGMDSHPSLEAVKEALEEKFGYRYILSGAIAVNVLGLSEQVPAKIRFLTDGPPKTLLVGGMTININQTSPRRMSTGKRSGLVIEALRYLKQGGIQNFHISHLNKTLTNEDKDALIKDLKFSPIWLHKYLKKVAEK